MSAEIVASAAGAEQSQTVDSRYSPLVQQLFDRRPHAGRMDPHPDVREGHAGSALDGTEVRFWLKLSGDRIQATSFQAFGCPHVIAAAAWVAQRARGMQLAEVARANWRSAEQVLAFPPEKRGRLLIVEDALQAAARSLR